MTDYNSYKSWPFNEAKKIIKRFGENNTKEKIIFETGYGPSGLPHIGTFGEVLRTNMVRFCYEKLTGKQTDLIAFSDDMDGFRKVPDNIPNKEKLSKYLDYPLTSVPDPFDEFKSFGEHNNSKLKEFLNRFNLPFTFQSSTDAYKSGLFNDTIKKIIKNYDEILWVGSGKGVTSVRTIDELKWKRKNLKKFKFLSKQYDAVINKCNSYRF